MRKLIRRGKCIKYSNNAELARVDVEIQRYLESNGEKVSTPVRAFLIFEDEEGYQRACHLEKRTFCFRTQSDASWLGKPLYFKAAPESSNIIWQNQWTPRSVKYLKKAIALFVVLLIIAAQIVFMFALDKKIYSYYGLYQNLECDYVR